jgi:hypothetical protein
MLVRDGRRRPTHAAVPRTYRNTGTFPSGYRAELPPTHTQPRSNLPAAVAAQYLEPIASWDSVGCGHTGQAAASTASWTAVGLADPVMACRQLSSSGRVKCLKWTVFMRMGFLAPAAARPT